MKPDASANFNKTKQYNNAKIVSVCPLLSRPTKKDGTSARLYTRPGKTEDNRAIPFHRIAPEPAQVKTPPDRSFPPLASNFQDTPTVLLPAIRCKGGEGGAGSRHFEPMAVPHRGLRAADLSTERAPQQQQSDQMVCHRGGLGDSVLGRRSGGQRMYPRPWSAI